MMGVSSTLAGKGWVFAMPELPALELFFEANDNRYLLC